MWDGRSKGFVDKGKRASVGDQECHIIVTQENKLLSISPSVFLKVAPRKMEDCFHPAKFLNGLGHGEFGWSRTEKTLAFCFQEGHCRNRVGSWRLHYGKMPKKLFNIGMH